MKSRLRRSLNQTRRPGATIMITGLKLQQWERFMWSVFSTEGHKNNVGSSNP